MKEYLIKLPEITIEAVSKDEAYGLVMQWMATTLGALPISNGVIIKQAEVIDLKASSVPKISKNNICQ